MSTVLCPAYIALGSNLKDPAAQVRCAVARIASSAGIRVELSSRLYRSAPLGPQDQPDFVNAVIGVLTSLGARELLASLLDIERAMGRDRRERWGPRVIDLDLVWRIGEPLDEEGLILPHPGVSVRNFVLYPLADIAPTLRIPGLPAVAELADRVGGKGLSVLQG